jgi:hypothetical protein
MEIMNKNRSHLDDFSFYDDDAEENEHEKTYVTVHADSFNEKDFNNLLNCLDTIRESEKKRKKDVKVIKNYCVQVPYIDNSIVMKDDDDDDDMQGDELDRTCNEMKSNISQMFSYFDEDVRLDFDDYDKVDKAPSKRRISNSLNVTAPTFSSNAKSPKKSENFREKFLRNQKKIKEMSEAAAAKRAAIDTRPIIRGVIKKPNAPCTPNNSLNKNQVDKIMNEFNRVKINYYSKENYVEFTNIDYFYCDSDMESIRSEKIGKLKQNVISKFESPEKEKNGRNSPSAVGDTVVVPKNSVRDKIDMFSKLDIIFKPCNGGELRKASTAPIIMTTKKENEKLQRSTPSGQMKNIIKNTSGANKNQNKCFIKDINNSLLDQVKKDDSLKQDGNDESLQDVLDKIVSCTHLNDVKLLMELERIVNKFDMSLLRTIEGLLNDDAFTLVGNRMRHLNVETRPSLERFNETFDGEKIDMAMENVELSDIEANKIQLQMQVNVANLATMDEKKSVKINVIFMAQYETDECLVPATSEGVATNEFFIFFTSCFEVHNGNLAASNGFGFGYNCQFFSEFNQFIFFICLFDQSSSRFRTFC